MNAWWQARTARERLALLFGAGALALLALTLLLEPIAERRAWLARDVPRLATDLAWLRANAGEFTRLRADAPAAAPLTVVDVEAALRRAALLDRVRDLRVEARTGSVRFAFDAVPFAALIDFLHELRGRAQVVAARIEAMDGCPGVADATNQLLGKPPLGVPESPPIAGAPAQSTGAQSMGVPNPPNPQSPDPQLVGVPNRDAKTNSGCPHSGDSHSAQAGFVRGDLSLGALGGEGAGGR